MDTDEIHDQLGGSGEAAEAERRTLSVARARSAELGNEIAANPSRFTVLTGDRPTGALHVGHFFGSLENRVRLQNLGVATMVLVADYQVITDRDDVGPIRDRVLGLVADYIAVGIDESKSTIFAHSAVPALNQLMLPFLALVSDSELRRNPTVKAESAATEGRPLSGLMLTYPVHQAADILFCKANVVPVGKDQLPHLEQARVIARRFDSIYGRGQSERPIFPEPEALLSEGLNILGTDGKKMSKSRGNAIELGMSPDETVAVLRRAKTDSERTITYEPDRRPLVANLLLLLSYVVAESPEDLAEQIGSGGSSILKTRLAEAINDKFAGMRKRRAELLADPGYLLSVLARGNDRANAIAEATLEEVRDAMQMSYAV